MPELKQNRCLRAYILVEYGMIQLFGVMIGAQGWLDGWDSARGCICRKQSWSFRSATH